MIMLLFTVIFFKRILELIERPSYMYNALVRHADYSIFARECRRVHVDMGQLKLCEAPHPLSRATFPLLIVCLYSTERE